MSKDEALTLDITGVSLLKVLLFDLSTVELNIMLQFKLVLYQCNSGFSNQRHSYNVHCLTYSLTNPLRNSGPTVAEFYNAKGGGESQMSWLTGEETPFGSRLEH